MTGFDLITLYFERDLSPNMWSSLAQCENEMHMLSSVTIHINSPHLCFVVGTWLSEDAGKRVSSLPIECLFALFPPGRCSGGTLALHF